MPKKKTHFVILLVLFLFPLLLLGGGLFFITRSSGFSIAKISSRIDYPANWEIDPMSEEQREILYQEIFPQNYYYLAAGNQCYTFISEDQKYVIKFFKTRSLFPENWMKNFFLSLLQKFRSKDEITDQLFSERVFTNYKDAYRSLRKETGLLYLHFNKSHEFKASITLIDVNGKKDFLDLDTVKFVIQKRAQKIFDHFGDLIAEGKLEELKTSIRSFLELISVRCEKGFVDQNLSIRNNFGFVSSTEAIQLDCCTLTRDSSIKYPLNFRNEVMQAAERLDLWAQEYYPEITLFIQEEAQRIINHSF